MILIKKLLSILILFLLIPPYAQAGTYTLPNGLTELGSEAFAGCTSLDEIILSASVVTIGEQVFSGVTAPVLVRTEPGSAAMTYSLSNGVDFYADTTCRALIIGECHYSDANILNGTLNDIRIIDTMLQGCTIPYQTTLLTDLTADQLRAAIPAAFADAKAQDISLVYYSGHGSAWGGSLLCVGDDVVTAAELRECLDAVPGRKVVIVDACYSGGLIGKSRSEDFAADFTSAFMAAFIAAPRSNLAADALYYVMTSSHSSQTSKEATTNGVSYGLFTYYLAQGTGYDFLTGASCERGADTDSDGVITFMEAFRYARIHANSVNPGQTAQVWPADCGSFGLIR